MIAYSKSKEGTAVEGVGDLSAVDIQDRIKMMTRRDLKMN